MFNPSYSPKYYVFCKVNQEKIRVWECTIAHLNMMLVGSVS